MYYPWIISLFAVLNLYSVNLGEIRGKEVPLTLLFCLIFTTLLFYTIRAILKNAGKSAAVTALLLIMFYIYGHLVGNPLLLAIFLTLPAVLIIIVLRKTVGNVPEKITQILNTVCLALLILPTINILTYWQQQLSITADKLLAIGATPAYAEKLLNSRERPDIYYIILDGYSSNRHFMEAFGYDNSHFTDTLKEQGFFVAENSMSNYGATLHSLSSSLNIKYVPKNTTEGGVDDLAYLRVLVANNQVAEQLIEKGYTYLNFMSGYIYSSTLADVNYDVTPSGIKEYRLNTIDPALSADQQEARKEEWFNGHIRDFSLGSFYLTFANTTPLIHIKNALGYLYNKSRERPLWWGDSRRLDQLMAELKTVAKKPEATFTVAHFLEPHGPVQYKRDGSKLKEHTWKPSEKQFFAELEYINEKVIELIKDLIANSPQPPIIILQGDHGTTLGRVWTDNNDLRHFQILNAFLLPGQKPETLTKNISPVNSFRVILNHYFDGNYKLIETKHFDIPRGYKAPFDQIDVTKDYSDNQN